MYQSKLTSSPRRDNRRPRLLDVLRLGLRYQRLLLVVFLLYLVLLLPRVEAGLVGDAVEYAEDEGRPARYLQDGESVSAGNLLL